MFLNSVTQSVQHLSRSHIGLPPSQFIVSTSTRAYGDFYTVGETDAFPGAQIHEQSLE